MVRTDWGRRLTLLFSLEKAEVCGQVYLLCVINQSALFTALVYLSSASPKGSPSGQSKQGSSHCFNYQKLSTL